MDGGPADDRFRIEKARALAALGRDEEAVALATESATCLTESRPEQAGRAYAIAAEVTPERRRRRALELYERAPSSPSGTPSSCASSTRRWRELLEQEGRKDEALELLKRAVADAARVARARIDSPVC